MYDTNPQGSLSMVLFHYLLT
ncbi:unnamed protein product [Debaryomyces tyrocola]|nr:unnamed protein product [Debaryomyces tyrocola]